jgi:hypothetical protein
MLQFVEKDGFVLYGQVCVVHITIDFKVGLKTPVIQITGTDYGYFVVCYNRFGMNKFILNFIDAHSGSQ